MQVGGPVPADSVFHMARIGRYDAVLSLYHDQGHIAAKMMDFEKTVSVTLGLPIVRTSVDHGTAFDIAGTGKASAVSMIEAVRVATEYAVRSVKLGDAGEGRTAQTVRASPLTLGVRAPRPLPRNERGVTEPSYRLQDRLRLHLRRHLPPPIGVARQYRFVRAQ